MTSTMEALARDLYAAVQEYHGRDDRGFGSLTEREQAQWEQAAVHALESATDRIIEAGRPIWWTTEEEAGAHS